MTSKAPVFRSIAWSALVNAANKGNKDKTEHVYTFGGRVRKYERKPYKD